MLPQAIMRLACGCCGLALGLQLFYCLVYVEPALLPRSGVKVPKHYYRTFTGI
jgi:hypothetical protein